MSNNPNSYTLAEILRMAEILKKSGSAPDVERNLPSLRFTIEDEDHRVPLGKHLWSAFDGLEEGHPEFHKELMALHGNTEIFGPCPCRPPGH